MDLPQKNLLTGKELLERITSNSPKDYSSLVRKSYHDTLPLVSLCYSSLCNLGCSLDPNWDEVTLSCRGIIINTETNKIVSKPWNKFFNYNPEVNKYDLTKNSYILEKLDGSLGITYREPGTNRIRIATKNSFNNEMTDQANAWLDKIIKKNGGDFFNSYVTYLFEIIYPENYSTVINYGDRRECVLLGMINTSSGNEFKFDEVENFGKKYNISVPKRYSFENFQTIVNHCKTLPWNDEGYVVTLPEHGNCKYKLKGAEFVEIHRLVFGLGPRRIWKSIRDGIDLPSALSVIPNEIKEEKLKIYNEILLERENVIKEAKFEFDKIFNDGISRRDFALKIQASLPKKMHGLMFALLDNNEEKLQMAALRQIEDKYKQKEEVIEE